MAEMLAGPWTSLAVALALTALVAAESRWLPWSPFFHAYAALTLAVPFLAGGWSWGSPAVWREHAGLIAGGAAAMLLWELGAATWFYERVLLGLRNRADDPAWSPSAALDGLLAETMRRARFGARAVPAVYGAYSLVWAPLAEELFYWGYLYGNLRQALPFWAAAAITSACFGARHAIHFLFLGPGRYPWPAAAWLAASTAITGLLNSWLYERIGALSPLMAIHLAANLLFAAYAAATAASRPAPGRAGAAP